ncbi:MAG: recombinase RecT, partial [Peptococcus niger]
DDVMDHAKQFSKSVNNGPWKTNFDEMAKKTVLKKVLKYAPIKTEFARGIAQDETVKSAIDQDMASQPDELDYIDVAGPSVDPETGEELFDGKTSAELDAELAKE